LLLPRTILSDSSCSKLRENVILNNGLQSIVNINEHNKYINASQSLSAITLNKSKKSSWVRVFKDVDDLSDSSTIHMDKLIDQEHGSCILILDDEEYNILNKMGNFYKLKDLNYIINNRGEMDVTLNKKHIQKKK